MNTDYLRFFLKSELGGRGSRIRDITFEEKNLFCFEVFSTVYVEVFKM